MDDFRFDKTAFKKQSLIEADRANVFEKNVSYSERLRQAYYLISQAYGFSMSDQPRLDRTYFSSRKQNCWWPRSLMTTSGILFRHWMITRWTISSWEAMPWYFMVIGESLAIWIFGSTEQRKIIQRSRFCPINAIWWEWFNHTVYSLK